ncbi:MAG: hypothetical protein M0C28_17580 [Candidatus Moduliflexus flocculans]|nr:hypothetical protein [Candidatus Moduliflexus flocculans]
MDYEKTHQTGQQSEVSLPLSLRGLLARKDGWWVPLPNNLDAVAAGSNGKACGNPTGNPLGCT